MSRDWPSEYDQPDEYDEPTFQQVAAQRKSEDQMYSEFTEQCPECYSHSSTHATGCPWNLLNS